MRRLRLDFAQAPARSLGWAAALLALGLLALGLALLRLATLGAQVDRLAAEVDDAQRATRHEHRDLAPASGEDQEALARELARANLVVASLNLGWTALFRQLESVRVPGVTLLAVQQDAAAARRIRLSGEAARLEDALAYVARIAGTAEFGNAHLVSHEAVVDGDRRAVRFAVAMDWAGQP
jgi:hypothetical protein